MIKHFLTNSNNIDKDSYLWNMIGSMLNAFQSVIFLMILTRAVDLYEAGVFTIAYANANLFLNIGKYGVRNFQVSDARNQFNFQEYKISRYITVILMIIISILYTIYSSNVNNYEQEKSLTIIWMCLFKAVDALEDVYHGLYQRNDRLDVAGKCMTIRMVLTIIIFGVCLIFYKKLLPSLIVTTISTTIIYIILNSLCYSKFKVEFEVPDIKSVSNKQIINILKICFPLFLGLFLAFYIGNAPKYAIDSTLSSESQAIYGFIAMPVFVIGLLNSFIFNPVIAKMSIMWSDQNYNSFKKLLLKQILVIVAIIFICEIGAFILGIPVLSILYHTDLHGYKAELLILLLGGGFLAFSGLFVTILTIMRKQTTLAIGYIIVSLMALIMSPIFVKKYEIMGAAVLYLVLMIILCVIFAIPMILILKKHSK